MCEYGKRIWQRGYCAGNEGNHSVRVPGCRPGQERFLCTPTGISKGFLDPGDICVVDAEGNAASMTHSLGMPSGVITDGLGFMYNGCMAVFDPRPGRANSLAPGKSRFSSLCPAMTFDGDELRHVVGAPGGTQIAMGVTQALLNSIEGYRGEPRNKPPFPTTNGLFGRPTAINNVETMVNVNQIMMLGGEAFAEHITTKTPVYIEGRLQLDQWEQDGEPRSRLLIRVEDWQFLMAKSA